MNTEIKVIRVGEENFEEMRSSFLKQKRVCHPTETDFGTSYYPAVFGSSYKDNSFILTVNKNPCALVLVGLIGNTLSRFGGPIKIDLDNSLNRDLCRSLIKISLTEIKSLAPKNSSLVLEENPDVIMSPLGESCMKIGGLSSLKVIGEVDLSMNQNLIKNKIRKSYRSLISWGRRNIELVVFDKSNKDISLFEEYKKFHFRESGRKTRSDESWDVMRESILKGNGELILGYIDGKLVSGNMTFDGKSISIYASGVYDRARFDLPLAHWPMFSAILRAQDRGIKIFELGEVGPSPYHDDKAKNIAFFKSGFASRFRSSLLWTLKNE